MRQEDQQLSLYRIMNRSTKLRILRLSWRSVGLSLLIFSGPGWSAKLSLDDALRLAVSQHPVIDQRRSLQDAAKGALDTANRSRWPSLSGQTGKDYYGKATFTVRVEQALWTGGRLTGQIDQANAGVQSAAAALEESQQDILVRTVIAYTELGRLESRATAARANVAEHERLRTMIFNRIDSQITPGSDGTLVSARLAQANAELGQILALSARARTTLAQLVGQSINAIAVPLAPMFGVKLLESAVDAALIFSPTLRRLDAQAEAAYAEVRIRRALALPQIVLRHENTQGGQQPGHSTYVALEYQTGAGLSNHRQSVEAEARYRAALAEKEAARRSVIETTSADWADLASFKIQTSDLQAQVQAQALVHESYVRQYVVGRKNWIELLNAQRELAQARYALADVEWGELRSQLQLQLTTGELSAATLTNPS
jgi:adhesin transport system outer membrane protein